MKILIYSHSFAPQIGGVETYAMLLASGLATRDEGNAAAVTVITQSPKKDFDDSAMPFAIVRQPTVTQVRKLIRESDVVHLAGPVIMPLILALLAHKPIVVEHHGYQASCPNGLLLYQPTKTACPNRYMRNEFSTCLKCNASESGWLASVKMLLLTPLRRWLCRRVNVNLCISKHILQRLELPRSVVVYYGVPQTNENLLNIQVSEISSQSLDPTLSIAYVGRLTSSSKKMSPQFGVDAVRLAQASGYRIALKIIGDGPDRPRALKPQSVRTLSGSAHRANRFLCPAGRSAEKRSARRRSRRDSNYHGRNRRPRRHGTTRSRQASNCFRYRWSRGSCRRRRPEISSRKRAGSRCMSSSVSRRPRSAARTWRPRKKSRHHSFFSRPHDRRTFSDVSETVRRKIQ